LQGQEATNPRGKVWGVQKIDVFRALKKRGGGPPGEKQPSRGSMQNSVRPL